LSQTILPDLILCDLRLPGLSGFDLIATVQSRRATADIPFMIVTGSEVEIPAEWQHHPAFLGLVYKPFSLSELVETIQTHFKLPTESSPGSEANCGAL
jgi:CheY-like chemotaxis protein